MDHNTNTQIPNARNVRNKAKLVLFTQEELDRINSAKEKKGYKAFASYIRAMTLHCSDLILAEEQSFSQIPQTG